MLINKNMKILLILPEDIKGERCGGVTTSTLILAKYLAKKGNNVSVLSLANKNDYYLRDNYKVFRIRFVI